MIQILLDGFILGNIDVIEGVSEVTEATSWTLSPSEIDTWYGDFTYSGATIDTIYSLPGKENSSEDEFNNFTYTDLLTMDDYKKEVETKETIYIYKGLVDQVGESVLGSVEYNIQASSDIFDDAMKTKPGKRGKSHYWNWTMRGLAKIATKDKGDYNDDLGAGKRNGLFIL